MFQQGQRIICIDDTDSQGMLTYLQKYIVRYNHQDSFVTVEGVSREWVSSRFVLAEGQE